MTLGEFEKNMRAIRTSCENVARLESLHTQILAFHEMLLSGDVYGQHGYEMDSAIDDLQAGLENLAARVESELQANKKNADSVYHTFAHEIFTA